MPELFETSASDLAHALADGRITAEAVAASCLERIRFRDEAVHAWSHVEPETVLERARALDATPRRGLLHGLPLCVKDIMDTADLPTAYGSDIYRGHQPAWDASCAALARAAGAVVFGKTVSTEFAYFRPGPTANPRNPAHTPGGSSSGTAAAVADAMVPFGFGSQTAGSIIRPAAFCGIVGFKPTFGHFSLAGVKPLAPGLDTLGWMARRVDDIILLRAGLLGLASLPIGTAPMTPPRIAFCRTHEWPHADAGTQDILAEAARSLAAEGAQISEIELPAEFAGLVAAQKTIMAFEAARALAFEKAAHGERLSGQLLELLDEGGRCSFQDYLAAGALARACRLRLASVFDGCDVLLVPSAPGEAPFGLAATGDPVFNRIWTLLHTPAITLPCGTGPRGLPLGIQLIGRIDDDDRLLEIARWAEARIGQR